MIPNEELVLPDFPTGSRSASRVLALLGPGERKVCFSQDPSQHLLTFLHPSSSPSPLLIPERHPPVPASTPASPPHSVPAPPAPAFLRGHPPVLQASAQAPWLLLPLPWGRLVGGWGLRGPSRCSGHGQDAPRAAGTGLGGTPGSQRGPTETGW